MRFDVRKLAILLLLAAPAAHAQLWSGPAAVEVRAEDAKGHALAGAQVLLQYTSLNPKDGPAPVATDSRGHADVGGLAEGPWHVEVSHDGFMTYVAEINVRRGGRPELVQATQLRVAGGGTSLMQVKISRGSAAAAPARAAAAATPPVKPETPAPTTRPVPATPAPWPEVKPAPQPPVQPVPPAQAQPAPEPPRQETPAPVAPAPQPPAPAIPTPPPAPVTAPPPAPPTPTPAPISPPSDAVRLRTARDRTCFECQPGESALSTEKVIPSGGGAGCGADIAARLKGGEVPSGLPPGCSVLRIVLPAGTRYTGYRYEIQDKGESLDCAVGKDCPQSTGRWPLEPVLIRDPKGTVVLAPFESGPADRERRAVLSAYFTSGKR
ncbi:MAG TPA: carboxypeptidase-like regulatory domain-containing protein [Thermoanaerobaculia bacterium]